MPLRISNVGPAICRDVPGNQVAGGSVKIYSATDRIIGTTGVNVADRDTRSTNRKTTALGANRIGRVHRKRAASGPVGIRRKSYRSRSGRSQRQLAVGGQRINRDVVGSLKNDIGIRSQALQSCLADFEIAGSCGCIGQIRQGHIVGAIVRIGIVLITYRYVGRIEQQCS